MTVSQKVLFSFLLSALFCAGIAVFAITGILVDYTNIIAIAGESAQIPVFAAVFLILFLIIFFFFNLRRGSAKVPEELQTAEEKPENVTDVDFMSAEAVHVESITGMGGSFFMFSQPFARTTVNPELLRTTENEVVYEQNGIHYINNNVFTSDERKDELDSNFAELVESVIKNGDQATREFELT